jgi:hypothetical protein
MMNAKPPTTETAMKVPAAKSQISVFVYSDIGGTFNKGPISMPTFASEAVI